MHSNGIGSITGQRQSDTNDWRLARCPRISAMKIPSAVYVRIYLAERLS